MLYVIIEQGNNMPVKNLLFKTFQEANIERIYLQPEYDNLLEVKGIK